MPLFEAMIKTGAMSLSSARLRKLKHSISSMWTSSINKTPGMISDFPSSLHSETLESICSLTSVFCVSSHVCAREKEKKGFEISKRKGKASERIGRRRKEKDSHLDLSGITCKEGEKTLSSAVDDVDFMQTDGVYDFLSLLDLSFGAVDKLDLYTIKQRKAMERKASHSIRSFGFEFVFVTLKERKKTNSGSGNMMIASTSERSSNLCNAATCFVDRDHISFVFFPQQTTIR